MLCAGGAGAARCWSVRSVGGVLHEVGVLLGEGWVYCVGVGGSCSMDNPWPVDPDPRGVGLGRQAAGRPRRRLGEVVPDPRGVRISRSGAGPQVNECELNPQGWPQRVPDAIAVRNLET